MNTALQLNPYQFRFTEPERRIFKAKEKITVSQWAERYRYVESGPFRGPWSNATTPYTVEPMDCWNVPSIRTVILCWGPQTAKTQVAFNCLLYSIDQDPGSAMYIMPIEKTTKRISKRRIIPMFKMTPRIRALLSPKFDDTSTLAIQFQNGMDLMMAWATSAAELASESVRYLFFDECDKYPEFTDKEVDPISLGEQRATTYQYTSKILKFSTPEEEGGYIDSAMKNEADEIRRYHVPCPVCGEYQIMLFDQITWPKDIRDPRLIRRKKLAHYECSTCGMHWDDHMRDQAVKLGKWIPDKAVERPEVVAYHLPSWYSPFVSLSKCAAAFLVGQEDPGKLRIFVTQYKAEPWKKTITSQKENTVLTHRTDLLPGIVPPEAIALTAGIDMQKLGFYFVVRAWAEDLTSWLVQYGYLAKFADVEDLIFKARFKVQGTDRDMGIWRAGLDTGGGKSDDGDYITRTEEAYEWLRKFQMLRTVFGTKGSSHDMGPKKMKLSVIDKMPRSNKPIPNGLELMILNADALKALLHFRLERKEEETQRFYLHAETDEIYARQLLAEEARRNRKGKIEWVQVRKANHYLDCECIAAACADSEWQPSLKILAAHMRQKKAESTVSNSSRGDENRVSRNIGSFERPGWLNR
jgi:phage terminase large subunit GpA-like protein